MMHWKTLGCRYWFCIYRGLLCTSRRTAPSHREETRGDTHTPSRSCYKCISSSVTTQCTFPSSEGIPSSARTASQLLPPGNAKPPKPSSNVLCGLGGEFNCSAPGTSRGNRYCVSLDVGRTLLRLLPSLYAAAGHGHHGRTGLQGSAGGCQGSSRVVAVCQGLSGGRDGGALSNRSTLPRFRGVGGGSDAKWRLHCTLNPHCRPCRG